MAYENLKKFVEEAIADTQAGRDLRLAFYAQPLCKMKDYDFSLEEHLVLCTMDRQLISDKLPAPKPPLDDFEVESNWPHPGDFSIDPSPPEAARRHRATVERTCRPLCLRLLP